jgi:hypothetical protein
VTVQDAGETDRILTELMGKDVEAALQVHHGARGPGRLDL